MTPKRRLTDEEFEKAKRLVAEETEARRWSSFRIVVEGEYLNGSFNHYNHVRNHIAKVLNDDGPFRNVTAK